jgi:hypothetical protein
MRHIALLLFLVTSLSSCIQNENKNINFQKKVEIDEYVYTSLKTHLTNFKYNNVNVDMIDSVMKYYALNETNIDKENCKLFPDNDEDDKLYYTFVDTIKNMKLGNCNKYSVLINLDLITLSNAEWGEGLSETIVSYWHKPSLLFVKAVAALSDSQIVSIYDTFPEGRDTLLLIIKRIENIPNIEQVGNYKKVIKHLYIIASHER